MRPYSELGRSQLPGLDARHHFCFAGYQDPDRMSWGCLRIVNDDRIAPGGGHKAHPCDGFEIVTYVAEGEIGHDGSFGEKHRTPAGQFQIVSTGTGIEHGEVNRSPAPARAIEFRFLADRRLGEATIARRAFPEAPRVWTPIASGRGEDDGAARIHADARLLALRLEARNAIGHAAEPDRHLYLLLVSGRARLNGMAMAAGDGAAIHGEDALLIEADEEALLILADAA